MEQICEEEEIKTEQFELQVKPETRKSKFADFVDFDEASDHSEADDAKVSEPNTPV